jgi:hypothetical protein
VATPTPSDPVDPPVEPPTGSIPVAPDRARAGPPGRTREPAADPPRTAWIGRATPPPPKPPPPEDPYWPPLEHPPGAGYTEPYPVFVPRRRRSGIRVLLFVAGLFAACCAGGATIALLTTASPGGTGSLGEAPPGINSVVSDGQFEFVVTAVTCGHESIGTLVKVKPSRGQYCIVDLTIKNTGSERQPFTDTLQRALDAQGAEFTADAGAGVVANNGLGTLWSVIEPGASMTGKIVYDLPKGSTIAKIELHHAIFSRGTTVTI